MIDTTIPFPDCVRSCDVVPHFGVSECESICPYKFDDDGEPIAPPEEEK